MKVLNEEPQVTGPDEYGMVYVHFQWPRPKLGCGAVGKSVEVMAKLVIDYDKNGKLYGIEIFDIEKEITPVALNALGEDA